MLKFSTDGNAKLKNIISFSLASGHSCPFAKECKSSVNEVTGKITDGKHTKFRCFSASQEALYPALRKQRFHNFNMLRVLKKQEDMFQLINESLPAVKKNGKGRIVRIHVGGDFFNQIYFNAWLDVARANPERLFYAYTKSLTYWISNTGQIPENFRLTSSRGGSQDFLIDELKLKEAVVVFSEKEAKKRKLTIDHDDSHAFDSDESFALLLHGTQPKGSEAALAKIELKKKGWAGYKKKEGRVKHKVLIS